MEISNATKAIFAIKAKNEAAVKSLKEAIKDKPAMSIHLLPDIYPMGEERAVVRECLDILLEPDKLPSAAHANVCNVESVLRVAEAVEDCKPCFSKNMPTGWSSRETARLIEQRLRDEGINVADKTHGKSLSFFPVADGHPEKILMAVQTDRKTVQQECRDRSRMPSSA